MDTVIGAVSDDLSGDLMAIGSSLPGALPEQAGEAFCRFPVVLGGFPVGPVQVSPWGALLGYDLAVVLVEDGPVASESGPGGLADHGLFYLDGLLDSPL